MTLTPTDAPAATLRWTARQRQALAGARHPHRHDPPPPPTTREAGWTWIQRFHAYKTPPLRYADAAAEALYAPRVASFADPTPPATLDPLTERLRAYVFHAEGRTDVILPAAALYPFWLGTAGLGFVFDLFRSPVIWAYGSREHRPWDLALPETAMAPLDPADRFTSSYGAFGNYGPTLSPLRRLLFALDADAWAAALAQARAWLAARDPLPDPIDDVRERAWIAWLLAREPAIAEALAREALASPHELGRSWSQLLVSVADRDLARAIIAHAARAAYLHMEPSGFLALVDAFGPDAAALLQALLDEIAALPRSLRGGAKEVRAALALAQSGQ